MASDGDGWVVVCQGTSSSGDIVAVRVSSAGELIDPPTHALVDATYYMRSNLKLAHSDGVFLLSYDDMYDTEGVLVAPGSVAAAGPDQTLQEGDTGVLDGTSSFDPDGTPLTYRWTLYGNEIATAAVAEISGLAPGIYTCELTVSDGQLSDTDAVNISVEDGSCTGACCPNVGSFAPRYGWLLVSAPGLWLLGRRRRRLERDLVASVRCAEGLA